MTTTRSSTRTLILGGGISGLLAAWHLRRKGLEVGVWEAAGAPGGWVQTLPWPGPAGQPGFLERGPQALRVGRGSALERLLGELGLELCPSSARGPRWLGKEGRRHPGPTTLAGLVRTPGLGLGGHLRMLLEPFLPAGGGPDETLHAFCARRLGAGFATELLPALVAGLLAAPPDRIGMAALPRLRRLESQGGLLLGSLRQGRECSRRPAGGMGALALALAAQVEVATHRLVRALEPLPGGRWRVHAEGLASTEADAVIVALPSPAAAALLRSVAPEAAKILESIPRLDLHVWHSRHAPVRGWERGLGLLIHPPEGRGLLGATSFPADDPRGVPGLLQVRTYVGGAYPVAPSLSHWAGVLEELRRWLPELGEAVQVREETCPGAFPLLEPGHGGRATRLLNDLPANLHWIGADRFGPGLPDLAEGMERWAEGYPVV